MSWSELWLAISNDLIYIIPLAIITILGYENISDHLQPKEGIKITIIDYLFLIILGLITLIAIYYLWITNIYYNRIQMGLAICLGIYLILLVASRGKMMTRNGYFVFSFSMMVFMLIFVTTLDIRAVQKGKYNGTIIKTDTETYISSDSNYFIGKTQDFVFIYQPKNFSTIIIPSNKIEKIIFESR